MSAATIKHIELRNGMKLLCRENRANPTVSIQLSVAAGSVDDPRDKIGLANFARALLTKGTIKHTPVQIAEKIDSLGLEIGFVSGRHTVGMAARVLAENLKPALKLIRELLAEPAPPSDEMERMRERIVTGIKQQMDDPASMAVNTLHEMIYGPDHPYGRTLKTRLKSIGKLNLDDVMSFYSEKLLPGAAIAVVVGDTDIEGIESLANETLGRWKGGGEFSLESPKSVSLPGEPSIKIIPMAEKPQADIALGFQGIRRLDPDYHALQVGNTVLGRLSLGGRIGQRVRDSEGMAYYAFSSFDAGIGAGPFMFRAGVNPAHASRAIELALEEIRRARDEGITAGEMDDAITFLAGAMARQVETNAGMGGTLLNQEVFGLGDDYYLRFESILREMTLDDVNRALASHLHPDNYCLAIAGQEGLEPSQPGTAWTY